MTRELLLNIARRLERARAKGPRHENTSAEDAFEDAVWAVEQAIREALDDTTLLTITGAK